MRVEPLDPRDARIAELERLLAAALARIAELEAMRGINSRNSSKPPSTDGFRRATPPKQNTGKKAGGQPGHTQHHCGCPILADVVGVLETFGAWLPRRILGDAHACHPARRFGPAAGHPCLAKLGRGTVSKLLTGAEIRG